MLHLNYALAGLSCNMLDSRIVKFKYLIKYKKKPR